MASLRKKYQNVGGEDKSSPVTTMPATASARPPEEAVDKQPPEPTAEPSAVEEAAQNAMQQRVREMQHAAEVVRGAAQQEPQYAAEPPKPQDPIAALPERVQKWYRDNPTYLTDPEKAAQVQYCHWVAKRETGGEFTEPYYDRMEAMLGLKQQVRPNGNGHVTSAPRNPSPQQYRGGAPVSAPPTRNVPSFSTGKPVSDLRMTQEEVSLARSLGLSDQDYLVQKKRLHQMKAAGQLQE